MIQNSLLLLAVLSLMVALSEWLARYTVLRFLGTALLSIVLTAVIANLGLIPTGAQEVPVYGAVFEYVAPLAIFFLLLHVNLKSIRRAGGPMLVLFFIGAAGTMLGVLLGMWLIDGRQVFGESFRAIAGMFVGTYTGGSVNFNAIALHYGIQKQGWFYAGANAVDNILTTLWMSVTLMLPRLAKSPVAEHDAHMSRPTEDSPPAGDDFEARLSPTLVLGMLMVAALGSLWLSQTLARLALQAGIRLPAILILTTLALGLAQIPGVARLRLHQTLGQFFIYLFLAVIGAYCDLGALRQIGELGTALFVLTTTIVLVHGAVVFAAGYWLYRDAGLAAVASQANIGGPPSAAAVAEGLQREDLLLPSVFVGVLGYGVGTYLGFFVAEVIY